MKLYRHLPNAITSGNLVCGVLAIIKTMEGNLIWAAYLVGIAAVLDFFDGFAARMLKVSSPIGKDLDSLADMVTFGIVPALVMYKLIELSDVISFAKQLSGAEAPYSFQKDSWLKFFGLAIAVFSALRLAKFNNDTRQSDSFIGVPTPANSILICGFIIIIDRLGLDLSNVQQMLKQSESFSQTGNLTGQITMYLLSTPWALVALSLALGLLLVSEIPLLALKFKNFGWADNKVRFIFLGLCALMLGVLQTTAIPLLIVLYVIVSIVNNIFHKTRV